MELGSPILLKSLRSCAQNEGLLLSVVKPSLHLCP